jgi:hypothetical protein
MGVPRRWIAGALREDAGDLEGYRYWGPCAGLQVGVVPPGVPLLIGLRAAMHVGGEGYPDGVLENLYSYELGAEAAYEIGGGDVVVRAGLGAGLLGQNGAGEKGTMLRTPFIAPAIGVFWRPGMVLGVEARPIFGLDERARSGLAFTVPVGFRT